MLYLKNNNFGDLLDEMNSMFGEVYKPQSNMMKTDIEENDKEYQFTVDMPGAKKENIKMDVKDGYLNISVHHDEHHDEHDKKGKFIRRERVYQSGSRSFYVGDVNEEAIKAKFENGILSINVPKQEVKQEAKKYIEIE